MITHDVGIKMNAIFSIPATETKFSHKCNGKNSTVNWVGLLLNFRNFDWYNGFVFFINPWLVAIFLSAPPSLKSWIRPCWHLNLHRCCKAFTVHTIKHIDGSACILARSNPMITTSMMNLHTWRRLRVHLYVIFPLIVFIHKYFASVLETVDVWKLFQK